MIGIDIPMPTDCVDCPMQYDGKCPVFWAVHPELFSDVTGKYDLDYWAYAFKEKHGKPDWCPLIDLSLDAEGAVF